MRRLLKFLGHGAFGALAALALLFTGEIALGVFQMVGTPFGGFSQTDEGFVNPVGISVWGADRAGFRAWDRIVAVDGELVFTGAMARQQALSGEVPRDVIYQVESLDGTARFVVMPSRLFSPSDLMRSHASQSLLGLAFVVIAILLYFLRPGTAEAWSFFAFFASLGIAFSSVVNETMLWRFPEIFTLVAPYMTLFGLLLVGVLSRAFNWKKPDDAAGKVLGRFMWGVVLVAFVCSTAVAMGYRAVKGDVEATIVAGNFLFGWLVIGTGTGLTALFIAYRRGRSPRRRARIRQILWAVPVGAGIPAVNLFIGHVLELTTISFLWNGFVLILPLATADAIVRHDLLHLNITARRLVGGITVAALMGMILGFMLWAAANFLSVNDAAGTVALAAILFALAAPINHRVQRYVESLLRQRRYDAGRLLADFTADASTAQHLERVVSVLSKTLELSVRPAAFELYGVDPGAERLLPQVESAEPSVLIDGDVRKLLERSEASVFDDEQPAPDSLGEAELALRLAVANEPVGLLVLFQRSDELAYEGADVAFVESLAGPLSAALVNTRAYEEVQTLNRSLEERVIDRTRALEETNRELELLNLRKDELVATVSHDFRSPLAVIRQNVQTMLRDLTAMDEEDLRHFLQGVGRQEERLTSMCENLLDLAKLKQQGGYRERISLLEIATEIIEGFADRAAAEKKELALEARGDESARVLGDGERLSQIMQNLVDNAIKFTPAGGRVTVSVTAPLEGDSVRVDVSDTGCGVPAEAVSRLFEPFFQVPSQHHAGQGSGLGLAIVKAVTEAHGGSIEVASSEGEGTTFTLTLPRAQNEPAVDVASTDGDTGDSELAQVH